MADCYKNTLCPQVIYVIRINDEDHMGCLKVGQKKLPGDIDITNLPADGEQVRKLAKERIDDYTGTAAIRYELLYAECSIYMRNGRIGWFDDHQVHEVLERSGIHKKEFSYNSQASEWFVTDLETVKSAIAAAKEKRKCLNPSEITTDRSPVILRPEQRDAVDKTKTKFSVLGSRMLWNCKMRFGKTLSTHQLIKEMRFNHTLIVTHRPVVDESWYEDFEKVFYDSSDYRYGSRERGEDFYTLANGENPFIYFASMQFLRNTSDASTKELRESILDFKWDFLIIDEAHEGTRTDLGKTVLKRLKGRKTCELDLSGTSFNIISDFEPDEIVSWTYIDEQRAKENWLREKPFDHNPYACLPHMNMSLYDLNEVFFEKYETLREDVLFNFREFFRVWTGIPYKDGRRLTNDSLIGRFVHEDDVKRFLDMLVDPELNTNYPFSTAEYRDIFRHTLWVLPGVAEAKAMSALLKTHDTFQIFDIINIAGDGDDDAENEEALQAVKKAIGDYPEDTRTITLTVACGRLTTGVTIKPWTAVLMLYGSAKTKAQGYMQTIFRVQTPAVIGGRQKEECYVFDFAPDRIITAIDETIRADSYAKKGVVGTKISTITDEDREAYRQFLHYCSVISYEGSKMRPYDVTELLEHLKRVQIDRVIRNGFEDDSLYNNDFLMNLADSDLKELDGLRGIIGRSNPSKTGDFTVNDQGVDGEEGSAPGMGGSRAKRPLTEEEIAALKEKKRRKKQKKDAISILRGISIRIPMLIYGADVKDEETGITLDNFTSFVDKESWAEFMPDGISMQKFLSLRKYYDPDVFKACGKRIRLMAAAADTLVPLDRIKRIEEILSTFRNPDKETVITPWRVVNMHLSDTIGGYDFFDDDHIFPLDEPRYVDRGKVTYCTIEKEDPKILEINSKSGRYPLYMTYSLFRERLKQWGDAGLIDLDNLTLEDQNAAWDDVVTNNIFILCKTPMAAKITKRTLVGYRNVPVNTKYEQGLVEKIDADLDALVKKIKQGKSYWHISKEKTMIHFDAIVSNPPYHESQTTENTASNSALAGALYPKFIDLAQALADKMPPTYVSMITESRWMTKAGRGVSDDWVEKQLHSKDFIQMHDFLDAEDCFKGVQIKGGVSYFLYKPGHRSGCQYILHQNGKVFEKSGPLDQTGAGIVIRDAYASEILERIVAVEGKYYEGKKSFMNIVGPSTLFCDCSKGILDTNWDGYVKEKDEEHNIKYYCNKNLESSGYGWICKGDMPKGTEYIEDHKVYIPKAGGSGNDKTILGAPFYGEPGSVCSRTYLLVGLNPDKKYSQEECENMISYMKTKFFRFMVSIKKKTQDAFAQVYQFVPMQDFSNHWTDAALYERYALSEDDINYIESMIQPME